MKTTVLIIMIALLTSFTANKVFSQTEELKPKKTPEERAEKVSGKLTNALTLTDEQKSQAYSILLSHFQKADQIRADANDKNSRKTQIKSLRQSTDEEIKAILTSDQAVKYNELKEKMKEKRKQKKNNLKQ